MVAKIGCDAVTVMYNQTIEAFMITQVVDILLKYEHVCNTRMFFFKSAYKNVNILENKEHDDYQCTRENKTVVKLTTKFT